jgi:fructosamine-3-kinase
MQAAGKTTQNSTWDSSKWVVFLARQRCHFRVECCTARMQAAEKDSAAHKSDRSMPAVASHITYLHVVLLEDLDEVFMANGAQLAHC